MTTGTALGLYLDSLRTQIIYADKRTTECRALEKEVARIEKIQRSKWNEKWEYQYVLNFPFMFSRQ